MTPIAPLGKRKRPVYAESSSEDDAPLASSSPVKLKSIAVPMPGALSATTLSASAVNGNGRKKRADSDADDDYDSEPKQKKRVSNGKAKGPARKKVKKEEDSGAESEDDKPIMVKKAVSKKRKKVKVESDIDAESEDDKPARKSVKKVMEKVKKEEGDASDTPKAKKRGKVKNEVEASPRKGKAKKAKDEDEEEEVYKWWETEDPNGDGTEKWKTLEHNGVIFPPPYEPLPKNVKMKYNGKTILQNMGLNPLTHLFREGSRPPTSC